MATRIVEGKKPYTGGKAIEITKDKVINLKLRDENNLIIYDEGDDEIYVDLQLADGIEPTDAFPVGVNTGRVLVADDWDKTGTLVVAKTTSGDYIELLYADDGTLWMDNGTGTFKQILFKGDIDTIVTNLTNYIDGELAKKQDLTVVDSTAPEDPTEGLLWYDTSSNTLKIYDGTTWQTAGGGGGGGGDVYVSTQANNIFTTGMKIWGGTISDFNDLTPDSNTAYLLLADQPTPPSPGRQPGADTLAYWKFDGDLTDEMGNYNGTVSNFTANFVPLPGDSNIQCMQYSTSRGYITLPSSLWLELGTQQTSFSFGVRWKATTFTSSRDQFLCLNGSGSWNTIRFQYTHSDFGVTNSLTLVTGASGSGQLDPYPIALSTGVRYNLWFTYDHTTRTKTYYMNGQLLGSVVSGADYTTSNTPLNAKIYESDGSGYMSDMILEKKTWTAQEVSDYFDQTKANYGIS